jgi:hypothetical protein
MPEAMRVHRSSYPFFSKTHESGLHGAVGEFCTLDAISCQAQKNALTVNGIIESAIPAHNLRAL